MPAQFPSALPIETRIPTFDPAAGIGIVAWPLQPVRVPDGVGLPNGNVQVPIGAPAHVRACPVLLSTNVTATCDGRTSGIASGIVGFSDLTVCNCTRAQPCVVA